MPSQDALKAKNNYQSGVIERQAKQKFFIRNNRKETRQRYSITKDIIFCRKLVKV